jgi:predicted dehydrogenase
MINRKLRMGMIGGGPGAFIGGVHRIAAGMDGEIELVCGAFSSDPEKSKQAGEQLNIPTQRIYGSYKEMIRSESSLPPGERMEIVSIVTPNHVHFEPTKLALENGFHVILDKPLVILPYAYLYRLPDCQGSKTAGVEWQVWKDQESLC